jgi:flagellar motor switch protein FliN/FliY
VNTGENRVGARLDAQEDTKQILDQWVESLAQVLESMTDQRPETGWQAASGTVSEVAAAAQAGPESEILWWEQPFQLGSDAKAWVGAPRALWEYAGTLTLKAAGLESVEAGETRNTWFEILSQSLPTMARSIGSLVGHEVNCAPGAEGPPPAAIGEWASVFVRFAEGPPGLLIAAFSASLIGQLTPPPAGHAAGANAAASPVREAAPGAVPARSRTMELLLDVDLPVSISFGKAEMPMRDVLKLTTGSIVELNRGVNEPVEVLINHCLIARGEVVVVDGNYGVRIQEIASRHDRLRSIR